MKRGTIYHRLMAQMYLKGYDSQRLAEEMEIPYASMRRKLRGDTALKLDEAITIRKILDCDAPLEELFERKERVHEA